MGRNKKVGNESPSVTGSGGKSRQIGRLIIIHPSGPGLSPTERSKKKPTLWSQLLSPSLWLHSYNIAKFTIRSNRNTVTSQQVLLIYRTRDESAPSRIRYLSHFIGIGLN
ncbi:hypothetical protein N7463_005004 [Penicillium fimorum]|uniref:Uncharacterized protein n=1 Tax=Penicillium fimorum TaxID=1882269 RepID=A0A9X0C588_9EURO|nr:hypothetical protein N7463_005004 [Penicillium fimorum]